MISERLSPGGTSTAERAERRRWIGLAVVLVAQLMMVLDGSIVNIALPRIQSDLHFSSASLTWIPNAYLISFGSFLLLGGRLGDLIGRTRVLFGGLSVFTLASVACGVAGSAAVLDVARFVQGLGAALAAPAILALMVTELSSPEERTKVMGWYTFVSVAGASVGLILGGLLTQALSWHWIFFINVPIGALALVVGWDVLPRGAGRGLREGIDVVGSMLATAGVMLAIYAVVTSDAHGVASAQTVIPFVAGLALLATFVWVEHHVAHPVLPPRIMRARTLMISCLVRALMVVGMFTTFYLCSLYLERVRGFDPIRTGLAFLPQTVTVAVFSIALTRRLVARFGTRPVMFTGMTLLTISSPILALRLHGDTGYAPTLVIAFILIGIGGGMSFMTLMRMAMAGVPAQDAGIAGGLVNVSLQIGSAAGVAVLGTIAATHTRALTHGGAAFADATAGGFRLSFWVLTGAVAAGLLIGARYLRPAAGHRVWVSPRPGPRIDAAAPEQPRLRR